jgi:hypothetical protein
MWNEAVHICWALRVKQCAFVKCAIWISANLFSEHHQTVIICQAHRMKQCVFVKCAEWSRKHLLSMRNWNSAYLLSGRNGTVRLSVGNETVRICRVGRMKRCPCWMRGMTQCVFVECVEWNSEYLLSGQDETVRLFSVRRSTESILRACRLKQRVFVEWACWNSAYVECVAGHSAYFSSVRSETVRVCRVGMIKQCVCRTFLVFFLATSNPPMSRIREKGRFRQISFFWDDLLRGTYWPKKPQIETFIILIVWVIQTGYKFYWFMKCFFLIVNWTCMLGDWKIFV